MTMPGVAARGISGTDKALVYAISAIARSGATRSGYVSSLPVITLDGKHARVLIASLVIQDALNEVPNTCSFTVQGARPRDGATVRISFGSSMLIFAGTLIRIHQAYLVGKPSNLVYQCEAIDWTWALNGHVVNGLYTGQSATVIARDLITKNAPPGGGYVQKVSDGLPEIAEISFTNVPLMDAIAQIAQRIGGYAKCDYQKRIWLYVTLPAGSVSPPRPLTPDHPTLSDVSYSRDLSQIATQTYVEGGGGETLCPVAPGETRIPVDAIAWYQDGGSYVVIGTQRIYHTGRLIAGEGAMTSAIGGATGNVAPASAPVIGTTPGAGLPAGAYRYAFTWVTAAGETLPSPLATFNNTAVAGPPAAPSASPVSGSGLGVGTYRYAYTWTTATGETKPSPDVYVETGQTVITPPGSAPSLTTDVGQGLPDGWYRYATTFVTAQGETTAGNDAAVLTQSQVSEIPAPTSSPTISTPTYGPGLEGGTYQYKYTFTNAQGETTGGSASNSITVKPTPANPTTKPTVADSFGGGQLTQGATYTVAYCFAWDTATPPLYVTGISPTQAYVVSGIKGMTINTPTPPSGMRAWVLISGPNQTSPLHYVESGSGGGTDFVITEWSDAEINARPVASHGSANTAAQGVVQISNIKAGPTGTTGRKLYRSRASGGGGGYYLHTVIADNVTTSLGQDTKADGSLGGAVPTSNTTDVFTYTQRVLITGVPIGPAGVTARRIYRTTKNGSQLKYLTQISDNTSTAVAGADTVADGSLGVNAPLVNTTTLYATRVSVSGIATGPSGTTGRNVYRSSVNGSSLYLVGSVGGNSTTTFTDSVPDSGLGAAAPTVGTAILSLATIGGILVGSGPVTSRKVYRTAVNAGALKLLATISNNTSTSISGGDSLADAALGAAVPVTDTSGLTSGPVGGQINAGATSIPVANVQPFGTEGWAQIGTQFIRYKGVSATHLTTIPSEGVGSLSISVPYDTVISVPSQLTGIPASGGGAVTLQILAGQQVNVMAYNINGAMVDFLKTVIGGDGRMDVYEQDGRLSFAECWARATARRQQRGQVLETIRYRVRDPNTQTGVAVVINLPVPTNIIGTYQIQDVTISGFLGTGLFPVYDVTASSARWSFEDLVRRIRSS